MVQVHVCTGLAWMTQILMQTRASVRIMQVHHLVCLTGVDSSPQPIAASRLVYTHETMIAFRTCFGLTLRLSSNERQLFA